MHPRQKELIELAKTTTLANTSYREIGRILGEEEAPVHPTTVKYHLNELIKAGYLTEADRPKARLFSPNVDQDIMLVRIPIVGSANCGPATLFTKDRIEGYLQVSPSKLQSKNYDNLFALVAEGNSMNQSNIGGDSINSGDYVIVDRSKIAPRNGDRVVVVNDGTANIKRFYFDNENQIIILRSESTIDYSPIIIDPQEQWNGLVNGTVIQVVKRPESN